MPLKVDPSLTEALYSEVQKNISVDFGEESLYLLYCSRVDDYSSGESYFMAQGMADAPLYFSALILSGQFERAIDLLVQVISFLIFRG